MERHPVMSREEERVTVTAWAGGDAKAGQRLVASNIRYVFGLARPYLRRGDDVYAEVVSAGMHGLCRALETFDPEYGVRFLTHAMPWARTTILRHMHETHRIVPMAVHARSRKALKAFVEHGAADAEELAERAQVSREEATLAMMAEPADVYLGNVEPLAPANDPGDAMDQASASYAVRLAVMKLSSAEQVIVRRRLMADEPASLVEIARVLGTSVSTVKRREQQVAARLRRALAKYREAA
jgi:RNA polymerase sigma-32 factor